MAAAVLTLNTRTPASMGSFAARHFTPGYDVYNLLFRALRVFRFQRKNGKIMLVFNGRLHGFDRIGLVHFDRDDAAADARRLQDEFQPVDDALRRFQHQAMIGGQVWLAFRAR